MNCIYWVELHYIMIHEQYIWPLNYQPTLTLFVDEVSTIDKGINQETLH